VGSASYQSSEDEHAEVLRLRAEVAELRGQGAGEGAGQSPRPTVTGGRWRPPAAALLIVLGCVLAPISVLSFWATNQVSNTDRYVANMAPLIDEPSVQRALSDKISAAVISKLNVKGLTSQAAAELSSDHLPRLSSLVSGLAGAIDSGVDSAVRSVTNQVVASPAAATAWVQVNRQAHAAVVKVLSGQGNGALKLVNGEVVLYLGPLIDQVKAALVAHGLTVASKLPTVNATFPLFAAPNLEKAQAGYRLLVDLKWVLPLLALGLMAAGVCVARRHRRALLATALGLSGGMLVLAAALAIARSIYLNSVPPSTLPADAAAVIYDTLVRFVRDGLRVLLVIGLVVALGAFLTGPASGAVRVRGLAKSGIHWLGDQGERAGLRTGPVGEWTGAHKTALRVGAVVVAALIFVFWGQPTVALVIWLVVVLLVILGLIELIGGNGPRSAGAGRVRAAAPR
jgi:hypothetical protein